MFVKKFEAQSLELALAQVKREMGPNALILSTEHKKGKWFNKSLVEVTAAYDRKAKDPAEESFDEQILSRQIFSSSPNSSSLDSESAGVSTS